MELHYLKTRGSLKQPDFKKRKNNLFIFVLTADSAAPGRQTHFGFSIRHQYEFKWKLCLSLAEEAVRCNSETAVGASMHLCPSHLRNTSTSDSHLVLPLKALMLQDVEESPPLFHCAVLGDWSLNQTVACVYFPPVQVSSIAPPYRGIWRSTVCLGQGDSPEFKTIAFFVPLLSHFTVGASCQPGNKCRMCVLLVHSQPRWPLSQCYDTRVSICTHVRVCVCVCMKVS